MTTSITEQFGLTTHNFEDPFGYDEYVRGNVLQEQRDYHSPFFMNEDDSPDGPEEDSDFILEQRAKLKADHEAYVDAEIFKVFKLFGCETEEAAYNIWICLNNIESPAFTVNEDLPF
jgi:hypothetical protein